MAEKPDELRLSRVSAKELSMIGGDGCFVEDDLGGSAKDAFDERRWRLSYLKAQFKSYELQNLFKKYTRKINHGYFSVFLILVAVLSALHTSLLFISSSAVDKDYLITIIPDLLLYPSCFILSVTCLFIVDRFLKIFGNLHYLSITALIIVFIINIFVPFYHKYKGEMTWVRPVYTCFLTISCYAFFDVYSNMKAFIMGSFVSVIGLITMIYCTYRPDILSKILADSIFFLCMNALGVFLRFMNEVTVRKSFLDRRDFITSTHQLRFEKNQMDQLMSSIIPNYLMDKVVDRYIQKELFQVRHRKSLVKNPIDEISSLLEEHENVTILFADIVNYTKMTKQLNVTDLLETLNEMFGMFDDYSEELKVSRVKFLGDCYYCVAGIPPNPAPNHAEACVDLGLAMISVIRNVRKRRNLNVDMRIGIHTGKTTSGIIGTVKYQYDIWSKDVDIANKMESLGCPGKVHITNKTKELLTKPYRIVPNTSEAINQLQQWQLETFLISPSVDSTCEHVPPETNQMRISPRTSIFKKQKSLPNELDRLHEAAIAKTIEEREHEQEGGSLDGSYSNRKRSALTRMKKRDSNNDGIDGKAHSLTIIEKNNLTADSTDAELPEQLYKRRYSNNPIRNSRMSERQAASGVKRRTAFMNNNIKRYVERTEAINNEMEETINKISFSKYRQYVRIKEINSIFLHFYDKSVELEYIKSTDPLFKYYMACCLVLIINIYMMQNISLDLHSSWNETPCWSFFAILGIILVFLPLSWTHFLCSKYISTAKRQVENKLIKCLAEVSKRILECFLVRLFIYTIILALSSFTVLLKVVACELEEIGPSSSTTRAVELKQCVITWQFTETYALVVIMAFIFLRMFIWIKFIYFTVLLSVYTYVALTYPTMENLESETINYKVEPYVAHIFVMGILTLTLHFIDRQTDYMNRLDFLMNKKVKDEQAEAGVLKDINKKLLNNILPEHVATIYLDMNREMNDLYYEEHEDVAVMFASLIFDEELTSLSDKMFLAVMNQYITSFDTLTTKKEFSNVEKIKLAKWTYMAACGLKGKELERHATSSSLETLLNFAAEMFKELDVVNRSSCQASQLRIGICTGPVVAGVVGSRKPLYDIWGDAVNMASRMDSTGVMGCIQVMDTTAELIKRIGIQCNYRGDIFVKGVNDKVQTYFVKLDENYNLIRRNYSISE